MKFNKEMLTVLTKAIETMGQEAQETVAIEECAEFIKALTKKWRKQPDYDNIIEEIADVTIMMKQMAMIYGEENVWETIKKKVERLAGRLEQVKNQQTNISKKEKTPNTESQSRKNISGRKDLTEDYIKENCNILDWEYISRYAKLSEPFIREFIDRVDWNQISLCQKLSEKFMRDYTDKLVWLWIPITQELSEGFIRDFADRLNWKDISQYQKLSKEFIIEFKQRLEKEYLLKNKYISKETVEEIF